jgi:hypothetical protein
MIANAVLVLTPQGVVVQPLYNASNLNLDKVIFDGLAELLIKDMVPQVLFYSGRSAAISEAQRYAGQNGTLAVKKNNLDTVPYFDFSDSDNKDETEFKMGYILTKQDLLAHNFTPAFGEIKQRVDAAKEIREDNPLSKEERTQIRNRLFSVPGLKSLELSPILRNIDKIIFEWDMAKIEEVISSLTTKPPSKREISDIEKEILREALLRIKDEAQQQRYSVASSPLVRLPDSVSGRTQSSPLSQRQASSSPME